MPLDPTDINKPLRQITLRDFLDALQSRYSIYIDRPPPGMESPDNYQAGKDNLLALRQMLRELGLLEVLADAFNTEYLKPRYRDT